MKRGWRIVICVILAGLLCGCEDAPSDTARRPTESGMESTPSEGSPQTTAEPVTDGPTDPVTPTNPEPPTPSVTEAVRVRPDPLSKEEIRSMLTTDIAEYIRNNALCDDTARLEVKIYDRDTWYGSLLGQNRFVRLGIDAGVFENYGNGVTLLQSVLYNYPEAEFRKMPDGMYYTAFESRDGDRLFWFGTEQNNLFALAGYPVLIHGPLKKYADFQNVTEGCTLRDVLECDATVKDYYDLFYQHSTINENSLRANKTTLRYTTVHYLTDGILVFAYGAINEKGELVVTEIRYSPDYTLQDCRGREIIYRINPADLP